MRLKFLAVASSIAVVTLCTVPKATGQINFLLNLLTPLIWLSAKYKKNIN